MNNETIGQSAEYSLCKVAKIKCNIDPKRINIISVDKFYRLFKKENILERLPEIKDSCGFKNGSVDYNLENNQTLSLKTLYYKDGKICPQKVGQPTLNAWDAIWETGWSGEFNKNPERWDFIRDNIHKYLNKMLEGLFCCDYLIIIKDCIENPRILFYNKESLKESLHYFQTQPIIYTRENYEERWNEKKQKNSEFSSTIKLNIEGNIIKIGEFQFHKSSRKVLKFRFFCEFLQMLF